MKKLSLFCMTVLAVFAMASCRGPQGPQGPAGQDGCANVYSATVRIPSTNTQGELIDWEWVNNCQWMAEIAYTAINNNIYNHGAVLVYMDIDGAWAQVPLTYFYQDEVVVTDESGHPVLDEHGHQVTEILNCAAAIEVHTLRDGVRLFWTENDFFDGRIPDPHDFKIVVIEAGLYSHRSDVDYSDYEAVKTAFQLAD